MTFSTPKALLAGVVSVALHCNATVAAPYCPDLLDAEQIAPKYQKLAPVFSDVGTGWIFGSDQFDSTYDMKPEANTLMTQIIERIRSKGVDLAILVPPPRPLIAGQGVLDATIGQDMDFNIAATSDSFHAMINQLRASGATVPDLLDVAQAMQPHHPFYFRRDTHWTHSGAAVSAAALATELDRNSFDLKDVLAKKTYQEKGSLAAIVSATCAQKTDSEETPTLNFGAIVASHGLGLLGEGYDTSIALLGTSFSDRNQRDEYQVGDALSAAMQMDVHNYSVSGGGMIGPIEAFILNGDLDRGEHDMLVWEFPYTESLNSTSGLRQLLGALRSDTVSGGIDHDLTVGTDGKAELDWSASSKATNLIRIGTENSAAKRVTVHITFENNKTKKVKMTRRSRIPVERRADVWWLDLSGWSHGGITNLAFEFERDLDLGQVRVTTFREAIES